MGLHLGWIPNEPGLRGLVSTRHRRREYPIPTRREAAELRAAHAARALWTRLLIVVGLLALVLFGLAGAASHRSWFWGVGVALAVCCWLPLLEFAVRRRRVATRLRREEDERAVRHAAAVEDYRRGKAAWQRLRGGAHRRRPPLAAGGGARGHHPARRLRRYPRRGGRTCSPGSARRCWPSAPSSSSTCRRTGSVTASSPGLGGRDLLPGLAAAAGPGATPLLAGRPARDRSSSLRWCTRTTRTTAAGRATT